MSDDNTESSEGETSESSASAEGEGPPVVRFGGRIVHNSKPESESGDSGGEDE